MRVLRGKRESQNTHTPSSGWTMPWGPQGRTHNIWPWNINVLWYFVERNPFFIFCIDMLQSHHCQHGKMSRQIYHPKKPNTITVNGNRDWGYYNLLWDLNDNTQKHHSWEDVPQAIKWCILPDKDMEIMWEELLHFFSIHYYFGFAKCLAKAGYNIVHRLSHEHFKYIL